MQRVDRIILIVLVIGVWGVLGTMWLKPNLVGAHADGHTHNSHEVFGVAKADHLHTYADVRHSHDYAETRHSHDYAEAEHSHGYAKKAHAHAPSDINNFKEMVIDILKKCSVTRAAIRC